MQISLIWEFLEARMTRTPLRSKKKKAVHSLPVFQADPWTVFFISRRFILVAELDTGKGVGPEELRHMVFIEKK